MIRTSITIAGAPVSEYDFTRISLSQSIGQHNHFEITMRRDQSKKLLDDRVKEWIGKDIAIGFDHEEDSSIDYSTVPTVFKGIITGLGLSRQAGEAELVLRGESPTIAMDAMPHTRAFTDCSLDEIVNTVIAPVRSKFKSNPNISDKRFGAVLEFVVQYRETSFDFLKRLANRYGQWFFYDGTELVFGDRLAAANAELDFGGGEMEYFEFNTRSLPSTFTLEGYDYLKESTKQPNRRMSTKKPTSLSTNAVGKLALGAAEKIYPEKASTFVSGLYAKAELDNLAQRKYDVALDETVVVQGASRNSKLRLGQAVRISDIEEDYGEFIITELHHSIGQTGGYSNSFQAIPVETDLPPLSSVPNPPNCEPVVGIVTDNADPEKLGRVKVEMMWGAGDDISPWLRVKTPYTGGDKKGFHFIPEKEDEVLVAFEGGNPEKPYVVGGFYNGSQRPTYDIADNHLKWIKTRSENEIIFDDKEERVEVHALKELMFSAGNKITVKTGHKEDEGKADSEILLDAGMGKIVLKAGEVEIHSETKNITLKSKQDISMDATKNISAKAKVGVEVNGTTAKIEAKATCDVKANGALNLQASGPLKVQGAIIKLN